MPPNVIESQQRESSKHIGIVVARFNELITNRMLDGALSALRENGVPEESIDLAYVPGSFEIGSAAQAMAQTGRYDAVVCIGAVVRGETAHFDYVSMAVTQASHARDTGYGSAVHVRRPNDGHDGAGAGAVRRTGEQPRLRRGGGRAGDGWASACNKKRHYPIR